MRTLDDVVAVGKEVVAKGYTALKTNVFLLDDHPRLHAPGFARGDYFPELNAERNVITPSAISSRRFARARDRTSTSWSI